MLTTQNYNDQEFEPGTTHLELQPPQPILKAREISISIQGLLITSKCFLDFLFFATISVSASSSPLTLMSCSFVPFCWFSLMSFSSSESLSVFPFVWEWYRLVGKSRLTCNPDSCELSPNLVSLSSTSASLVEAVWDTCLTVLWDRHKMIPSTLNNSYVRVCYHKILTCVREVKRTAVTYCWTFTTGPESFIDCHVYSVNSIC